MNSGSVEPNYALLGERVRKRRIEEHLTQIQLSEACGVSLSFISHIEHGKRKASLDTLLRIAFVLQLSIDYLLGWEVTGR